MALDGSESVGHLHKDTHLEQLVQKSISAIRRNALLQNDLSHKPMAIAIGSFQQRSSE